jgi:hypothetical protein
VSRLSRRLQALEAKVGAGRGLLGTLEIHALRAWPSCGTDGYAKCNEHAEGCAVRAGAFGVAGLHQIVRDVPWLGV